MAENVTTPISARAQSAMRRQRVAKVEVKEIAALTTKNVILVLHAGPASNGHSKLNAWHLLMLAQNA